MFNQEVSRLKLELGVGSELTSEEQAEVDAMVFHFSVVYELLSVMKLEESGSGIDALAQTHVELLLHDVHEYGIKKQWTADQTLRLLICAMQICDKTENSSLLVQFLTLLSQEKSRLMSAISTRHTLCSPANT